MLYELTKLKCLLCVVFSVLQCIGSSFKLEACRSYITLSIGSFGTFGCFDFDYNGMYRNFG
ncbi:hypothetical protein F383_03518 [Gossypium arboreum]|uniref:Uncharacterized protein n=1 Tax=Gossypium arboreum TaxID=29729 RepID=A0A0B0NKY2_GOSAR|nr:hypothetical protein F383_03518 [Gossypium arboreum]